MSNKVCNGMAIHDPFISTRNSCSVVGFVLYDAIYFSYSPTNKNQAG